MTVRLAPLVAAFKQSTASDVVANRVYIEPSPAEYRLDLKHVGDVLWTEPDTDGKTRIDIAALANADPRDFDGTYDIFITALDDAGNESSPLEFSGVTVDLTAPAAPAEGEIEN